MFRSATQRVASSASSDAPLRVLKFGGSSVGSASGFIGAAKVVTSHINSGSRMVMVLSAMYGVTNQARTPA